MQTDLSAFSSPVATPLVGVPSSLRVDRGNEDGTPTRGVATLETLLGMVRTTLRDYDSARPDVLVLPELIFPGPLPASHADPIAAFQSGAIQIPGPETHTLLPLSP